MEITIELPNRLGERLNTLPAPNDFIIKVLAQALDMDLQPNFDKAFCIEDAFGLYKPEHSVSLEDMEQAIKTGATK